MKTSSIPTFVSLFLLSGLQPVLAGNITVTPSNQANNLPLGGQGGIQNTQIIKVGTITLNTTSQNGFILNITGSNLVNSKGVTPIDIKITTVPAGSGTPGTGSFTSGVNQTYSYFNNISHASETRDLYILYTPASLQHPGNYSGYLNLNIIDK